MLPNFICPGAARSATTTLYYLLIQHPQVYLPPIKETRFFTLDYEKGLSWYEQKYYSKATNELAIGDISPVYFIDEECPKRIYNALGPKVKLIFMLRDPVKRAYSHYCMLKNHQFENLSFEEAINIDQDRRIKKSLRYYNHELGFQYLSESNYLQHLERYLTYFDFKQIKVIIFEEFIEDTEHQSINILDFLGILDHVKFDLDIYKNPSTITSSSRFNRFFYCNPVLQKTRDLIQCKTGWKTQSILKKLKSVYLTRQNDHIPPIDEKTEKQLYTFFNDKITRLESLLDKDLSIWQMPG